MAQEKMSYRLTDEEWNSLLRSPRKAEREAQNKKLEEMLLTLIVEDKR